MGSSSCSLIHEGCLDISRKMKFYHSLECQVFVDTVSQQVVNCFVFILNYRIHRTDIGHFKKKKAFKIKYKDQ